MGKEMKFQVIPYGVSYFCECGEEMKYKDGDILLSQPPKFKHECASCGKVENLTEKYPTIRWDMGYE